MGFYGLLGATVHPGAASLTQEANSTLYIERVIWVFKITLGGTAYHLGFEHFNANEIYVGSPIVYPILAGRPDDLVSGRLVGREIQQESRVEAKIYGKTHFTEYDKSFFDLFQENDGHEANCEVLAYFKSRDGTTTHSDSVNIRQGKLKVKSVSWDGDTLILSTKAVLFKDKEISRRFSTDVWSQVDPRFDGEYGAVVFGEGDGDIGVIIDAPYIEHQVGDVSLKPTMRLFCGWTATGHALKSLEGVYVANEFTQFDETEWLKLSVPGDPQAKIAGENDASASTAWVDFAMYDFDRGQVISPPIESGHWIISSVGMYLKVNGTPIRDDGELVLEVYFADSVDGGTTQTPSSGVLRRVQLDPAGIGLSGQEVHFQIDPPIAISANRNWLFTGRWTNQDDTTNYIGCRVNNDEGDSYYAKDLAETGRAFKREIDTNLFMTMYALGDGDDAFTDDKGTAPRRYADYHVEGKAAVLAGTEERKEIHKFNQYRVAVKGLEDDASGTITGGANAIIETPGDIIKFILLDDEIGVDHGSANIIDADFTTARSKAQADGYAMSIAIQEETFASDFILRVLRQSRLKMYTNREGLTGVHHPTPIDPSTLDNYISEGRYRDVFIGSYLDSPNDDVINDIEVVYGSDPLNAEIDPITLRRVSTREPLKKRAYINKSESSLDDLSREAKAASSEAQYGRRTVRETFDFYAADSNAPDDIVKYWLDRYYTKQKLVTAIVPIIEFKSLDLFDSVYLSHTNLPAKDGTADVVKWHNDGDPVTWYDDGIPITWRAEGEVRGEITGIREFGDQMEITIETQNPFRSS